MYIFKRNDKSQNTKNKEQILNYLTACLEVIVSTGEPGLIFISDVQKPTILRANLLLALVRQSIVNYSLKSVVERR
jgi:hypothetical protein